jgi:hypothetical protein
MYDLNVTGDDANLHSLFDELQPKRRVQAMKGALRAGAIKMRKTTQRNLRSSVRSNSRLEKGIRYGIHREKLAFYVTIEGKPGKGLDAKGEAGMYVNRFGRKKPVLHFLEVGSESVRITKSKKGKEIIQRRKGKLIHTGRYEKDRERESHSTGRLKAHRFFRRAVDAETPAVTKIVQEGLANSIIKTARKYGCK